jgi:hypothetical protein
MKRRFVILFVLILITGFHIQAFAQTIKGTYAIKNVQTGMLLRIKDANTQNGTPMVLYHPQDWKCMTWDFNHIDGNVYQLKNLFSGKTFQSRNGKVEESAAMEEQPLVAKQDNQLYEFVPAEKNVYLIKLKGTELYLTPSDEKGSVNSSVILAKKKDDKRQFWTIYEQEPTM